MLLMRAAIACPTQSKRETDNYVVFPVSPSTICRGVKLLSLSPAKSLPAASRRSQHKTVGLMRTHTGQLPRTACYRELIALFTCSCSRAVMGLISAGFQNRRIPAIVKGVLSIYGLTGLDSVPSNQGFKSDSLNPMVYGIERLGRSVLVSYGFPKANYI